VPLDSPVVRERFGSISLPFANSRTALALALAERGEFVEATVRCTEAIQIAEAVGHPHSVTVTYQRMGHLHLRRGIFTRQLLHSSTPWRSVREWTARLSFTLVSSTLGYVYALSGRSAESIPLLEEPSSARLGLTWRANRCEPSAERSVSAGRAGSGCPCRRTARPGSRPSAQRERTRGVHSSAPRRDRGARRSPDIGKAEDHYRQALALAEELGMRPLIAIATLVWANCTGRIGSTTS
jgi:hypothetical protein